MLHPLTVYMFVRDISAPRYENKMSMQKWYCNRLLGLYHTFEHLSSSSLEMKFIHIIISGL